MQDGPSYYGTYRFPAWAMLLYPACILLLAAISYAFWDDAIYIWLSENTRRRSLDYLPRPLVVAALTATNIALVTVVILHTHAAARGQLSFVLNHDGLWRYSLFGRPPRYMAWAAMTRATVDPRLSVFWGRGGDGGEVSLWASMMGQDAAAVHSVIRTYRPDMIIGNSL